MADPDRPEGAQPAAQPDNVPAGDDGSIGAILRRERERKGISLRQAADALRITIHKVEDLENNRFDRFPAPAYAKAFIKLYARYLGLDHRPLTERYMAEYVREEGSAILPEAAGPEHRDLAQKALENLRRWFSSFPGERPRRAPLVIGLIAATLVLLLALHMCSRRGSSQVTSRSPVGIPRYIEEPPQPYIEE
ncbi:MAG: hypothetical protein DRP22_03190 [Verrucomicrobia bacterium]|nr:MAG: hypothetical protein DRP22_03190 [Verrucomicrobiota bacterium]